MTQINTLHDTVRALQRSFHSFFPMHLLFIFWAL